MPWMTRKMIIWSSEPDSPHATEAPVNSTRAVRKVRRVPNRSPIHPDDGTATARLSR